MILRFDGERVVARNVLFARSFAQRLFGLLGRRALDDDEGMFFADAHSIHTYMMRTPIDVLFVSGTTDRLEIVSTQPSMEKNRAVNERRAQHVLELAPGFLDRHGVPRWLSLHDE
jgi:uncharacterized membrane protein (UPF0127 family)